MVETEQTHRFIVDYRAAAVRLQQAGAYAADLDAVDRLASQGSLSLTAFALLQRRHDAAFRGDGTIDVDELQHGMELVPTSPWERATSTSTATPTWSDRRARHAVISVSIAMPGLAGALAAISRTAAAMRSRSAGLSTSCARAFSRPWPRLWPAKA